MKKPELWPWGMVMCTGAMGFVRVNDIVSLEFECALGMALGCQYWRRLF